MLKPYFARLRPCYQMDHLVLFHDKCGGFWGLPSNHAANGMSIATYFLVRGYPKIGFFGFFSAFWVGYSRVYSGVHFPGDVLLGFACGGGIGFLIGILFEKVQSYFRDRFCKSPDPNNLSCHRA
ncbi:MAG: phosphatase PAP2 family protein [Oligoflexales bacterium]